MKKLLLPILLLAPCLNAKLIFSPINQMYYSTKMTPDLSPIKYDILAKYASKMIDAAFDEDISIEYIITHLKELLLADGSKEAEILSEDISEIWDI